MAKIEHEYTDRYIALGIPYPDPKTVCKAQCEGIGWVPVYVKKGDVSVSGLDNFKASNMRLEVLEEKDARLIALWEKAEQEKPSSDGWHFVKCPDCGGIGKEEGRKEEEDEKEK